MLYDEARKNISSACLVSEVKLKVRLIPPMPQRAMTELRFGEQAFFVLHRTNGSRTIARS